MAPTERSGVLWHRVLLFLIGLLVLPALFINLGSQAFIDDEGIRSLVAFEMLQSGEYIQASLNGEPYFKKPPLYNWILAAFFSATGVINEWTARIPTVLFLLLFCFLIYRGVSRGTGDRELALAGALLTLTCGRILFWDSFLGLIDMAFSTLIFGSFLWLYFTHSRGRMWAYFTGSWLLAALAFLLKGLPGLVFQVLTTTGHLLWQRQWRRLFHPAQFLGGGLFLMIVGGYYYLLLQGADAERVFGTLFTESAQRTPTHHDWGRVVRHVLAFPLEMTYHFLPWSMLLLFLWPLSTLRQRLREPFMGFLVLVFLVNIPVYWISPQVYPRYLLMLAPLVFVTGYHLYREVPERALLRRVFEGLFLGIGPLLALAAWLPLFLPRTREVAWLIPKVLALVVLMSFAAIAMWRFRRLLIYALIVQLLTLRLAFDWFVIPDRIAEDTATAARADARRIGAAYRDQPLYLLGSDPLETTSSYYLATSRGIITRVWREEPLPGVAYLIHGDARPTGNYQVLDTMRVRHFHDRTPYALLIAYPETPLNSQE
jgi:4-amino-4-deoxy-L-arabinose transferase-like glycosyltransferase